MYQSASVVNGLDLTDVAAVVAAMHPDGDVVAFDIRADEGDRPIIETLRSIVDDGKVVGLWDSALVMPGFAVVRVGSAYAVCDGDRTRGEFATLEDALRHGMTMWQGAGGG